MAQCSRNYYVIGAPVNKILMERKKKIPMNGLNTRIFPNMTITGHTVAKQSGGEKETTG